MKTILCPTDFSECAEGGVQYAHALALRTQARLVLLHAYYFPESIPYATSYLPESAYRETEAACASRLEALCQRLKEQHPDSPVTYVSQVQYNTPPEAITQAARKEGAELIVMGTAGAHGLQELILSSTAAEVIEMAGCPVLVIPAGMPPRPFRKMVVATDLKSTLSAEMSLVVELATRFDAQICFLHVLAEDTDQARTEARQGFNEVYQQLAYENVSFYCNQHEDIEEGITRFVHQQGADLLVMINHPRTFWQFLFQPSHTKHLAYHLQIPLLAIHQ